MNAHTSNELVELKCSVQRALIEQVTERLAAVTCGIKNKGITIIGYFDDPVTDEDVELLSDIAGEVLGDFPEDYTLDEIVRSVAEGPLEALDFWAFMRAPSAAGPHVPPPREGP